MEMKNLVLSICLIFACLLSISAQNSCRLLDMSVGLPDNEVKSLLWLPDGRLCARTSSSLSFFDGCYFRSFPPLGTEMCPIDYVAALPTAYVDAEQRIWVKETGHMFVFDLVTEKYVSDVKGLLSSMGVKERICNFFIDSAKGYWFVTDSGKFLYCQGHSQAKAVRISTRGVRDVASWAGKHWFVYSDGKVTCWKSDMTKELSRHFVWKGEMLARDFLQFSQNTEQLWVMWNHGLALWRPVAKEWQCRYATDKDVLVTMCAVSPKTCYVGLRRAGLLTLESDGRLSTQGEFDVLNGRDVKDAIQALAYRQGNLMVGMANHGILFCNPSMQLFPYVTMRECGLPIGEYMLNGGNGNDLLLTSSQGVYRMQMPQMRAYPLPLEGSDFIRGMVDSRKRVWVGTFNQGFLMWDGKKTYHVMQGTLAGKDVNYNIVREFLEDSRHRIWVSFHGGIGTLDNQLRIIPLEEKGLERYKVVNEFRIDKDENVWAATSQGLFCYSQKLRKVYFPKDFVHDAGMCNLLSAPCKALLVDRNGWVWVGTLNGVIVLRPRDKYAQHFGKKEGMPNEMTEGIIEDELGNVWVTTANGLCRFSHVGNQEFKLMVFDEQNKLGDAKFGWMALARVAAGKLLFGNQGGFYVVDPTKVQNLRYSGSPIFTSLLVNNQEITPGKELNGRVVLEKALSSTRKVVLRHDENFVTVCFTGLNFDMPRHTYYKYRLKGINDGWVEDSPQDGIGRASYTNLPPGEYELEVYSAGFDKKWSKQSVKLLVIVEPPVWSVWWAKLLYLSLLGGIAVYVFRRKQKLDNLRREAENNKELEEMKYRFFTNVTHEFRTLLTLIITPVGSILKRTSDEEIREQLKEVNKNAGDLLQLVNQLLDFRKMETKGERLDLKGGIIGEFVQYTAMKFSPLAAQRQIGLKYDDQTGGLFMYFDRDKVGKILNNLLSNAFKYTSAGGEVRVELCLCDSANRHFVRMSVVDTGCGISQKDQAHVFERFFRSSCQTTTNVGSGIGLNLVGEYVKLHQGHVRLESVEGKGSSFIVEIPADLMLEAQEMTSESMEYHEDTGEFADKCVLVVEDNVGFRNYLAKELGRIYNKVLMAADGLQGAAMASDCSPDIIVSDVMMPQMSGTEMCRRLKQDLSTSHIPVILLTAWSTDDGRAEGYKVGADAYISKPFDLEVLLARVNNLLEKQKERIQDFSHSPSLDVRNIAGSAPDEKFLAEIVSLIEKNITDSDYTVDALAADMAMSRMSVYRKMKALTGQTPTDFIRTVRLKAAATLLKRGQYHVSEVCYLTGFATPQNFTKHFKDMFGVVPSQYNG